MTEDSFRHFEDFIPGTSESYGSVIVPEGEMLAFAAEFDPQPMHLDPASRQAESMGGLLASGWYTCALNLRMLMDHFILKSASMGSPGCRSVRWTAPVRAGDKLTGMMHVLDRRASATKPDRGFVDFRFDLFNQNGEKVLEQINLIMFRRRMPGAAEAGSASAIARPEPETFSTTATADTIGYLDDITPGAVLRLGTYAFEAPAMIAFARKFDPQPFHVDEAAGKASHFGGLAASGWLTGAAWMQQLVHFWQERAKRYPIPKSGPGLGFTDMQFIRPVLADDTLTYYSRIVEARPSQSKPGWGILTQRNYAINQNGLPAIAFTASVLWQRKP